MNKVYKMDKDTTQSQKQKQFDTKIIDRLVEKYNLSRSYIYRSLRNESESETSETIRQDYKIGLKLRDQALQKI